MIKLKKIAIKNFKSLKDCTVDFSDSNVLVGPNASGKTNLVELFKLLKKIYAKEPFPFLDWWGYNNVVWDRREELPILAKLFFELDEYKCSFETVFTGVGGKFQILKETLEIEGVLTLEREGEWVCVKHNEHFFENAWKRVPPISEVFQNSFIFNQFHDRKKEDLIEQRIRISKGEIAYRVFGVFGSGMSASYKDDLVLTLVNYGTHELEQPYYLFILEPSIQEKRKVVSSGKSKIAFERLPLSRYAEDKMHRFFSEIRVLTRLDFRKMKEPAGQRKEASLSEDGSNVCNILYNLFLRENKIPTRVDSLISYIFHDTSLRFDLTQDGRVLMKLFEKYTSERYLELYSPGISDGFYKVLTILTALESEPSLLIIDEIENSLHAKALELIMDELKESECMTILTTHSPVVVDMVSPKDLILVEKEDEGSVFKRTEKPEEVSKQLSEAGITLSERWLYGKM